MWGHKLPFLAPLAIAEYNEYMGGAATNNFYSMGLFSVEGVRRCTNWAVRYFECLLSRFMAQAVIIGHVVNDYTRSRDDFQLSLFRDLFFGNFDHKYLQKREEGPGHPEVSHGL